MTQEITIFSESNENKTCQKIGHILHMHSSWVKYDQDTKLYQVPVFNGIYSPEITNLYFYGFRIYNIVRTRDSNEILVSIRESD